MTIAYRLNGALLPYETVRFNPEAEAIFPAVAWFGEAGVAGVIIEDQSGSLDIAGWNTFTVEETACAKPRIFTGWIAGKEISRGRDSNRVGVGRIWDCTIVDQNHIFSLEVFRSSAASVRPAETDVARVQAMIASHAMGGTPIYDNGRLSTDDPRNLSAANFVTQKPQDMLMSTAGQCLKNGYAYWSDADQQISFHYDAIGDGPAATISFSNVPGDYGPIESASTTCFAPSRDGKITEDPYNLYTGELLQDGSGRYTYQRNQELIDALSPTEFSPINFLRDNYESSSRIGRASTAAAYVAAQLERLGVEKVTLNFSVTLPARAVNLAHAGDIVNVRFSHLPGYETSTPVSIIRRSVQPVDGHDALYVVDYECANFAGAEAGGGGTPPFSTGTCLPTLVQSAQGHDDPATPGNWPTFTADLTEGNLLVASVTIIGTPGEEANPDGFTAVGAGWVDDPSGTKDLLQRWFYRVVQAGDDRIISLTEVGTVSEHSSTVGEFDLRGAVLDDYVITSSDADQTDPQDYPFDAATTTDNVPVLALASLFPSLNVNDAWHPDETTGAATLGTSGVGPISGGGDEPKSWVGYKVFDDTGGANVDFDVDGLDPSGISRGYAGLIVTFTGTCEGATGIPPLPGQTVPGTAPSETPNGTIDDFTAPTGPYESGTMEVSFNGSWLESGRDYTEADNEAGTVTFTDPPPANAQIVFRYKGL